MFDLKQPKEGFRYGIDSFLLARFAHFRKGDLVCDLGAGAGILGFLALQYFQVNSVVAVEIQEEMAQLALENALSLGFADRFVAENTSWQAFANQKKYGKFDVVLSNPPYRKKNTGKLSSNLSLAIAKHELKGNMRDLLQSTVKILKPEGRAYFIYPVLRLDELLQKLPQAQLKAQRLAFVHPYQDRPATHGMIEAVRSSVRELKIEAPTIVYQDAEHYTPEIEAWVGPKRQVGAVNKTDEPEVIEARMNHLGRADS